MSLTCLNAKLKRHPVLGKARVWAWVAPGNVPDPIVLAVIAARLRGAELILKLSKRNEAIGRRLVRKHVSPRQKVRTVVGYSEFRKLAAAADAWVVYGSDATIAAMESLGADRARIVAAVGPCIARASYEVDEAFRARFAEEDDENDRFFADGQAGHAWFDLEAYVAHRLASAGIGRVETLGQDTYAQPDRFYSYRRATHRSEPDYGRQISLIAL